MSDHQEVIVKFASRISLAALVLASGAGCDKKNDAPTPTVTSAPTAPPPKPAEPKLDAVPRMDFNRLAIELALPIFWSEDKNTNGAIDPAELAVYWGLDSTTTADQWVTVAEKNAEGGAGGLAFTPKFDAAYAEIVKRAKQGAGYPPNLDPPEVTRRNLVIKELSQGRPTLVATDLSAAKPEEKRFVGFIVKAAEIVERIHGKQIGTWDLRTQVPHDDAASKSLFFRNQGPKCGAPLTQKEPACSAIPTAVVGKPSGLYPAELLAQDKFCDALAAKKDKKLVDPFTVVVLASGKPGGGDKADAAAASDAKSDAKAEAKATPKTDAKDAGGIAAVGELKAIPYTEAYKDDMDAVSQALKSAAEVVTDEKEAPLKAYLAAAAQSFTDNNWVPADEAWAKMSVSNSKWYLRIAPDEIYAEPCSNKALFHVSFGLINQKSLKWQTKLDPLKTDMENALADLAGAPYKARSVTFKLPDFVDIALNAGDSRPPFGATIGQSLPNFGPVANEGRGRTVAMTNFYTDPDSNAAQKGVAESLLCKSVMPTYTQDPEPQLMSTVLHEAAHNLGPAHQYKVGGKIDRDAFGGPLASTFEELKAQTAALYFTDWLVDKKQITREEADKAHVRDVLWGFGHISRGMYDEDKHPRNYSQLAAIQLGALMKDGAVVWNAEEMAANDKDKGCFAIALDKFPPAAKSLMTAVAGIKARGDKKGAEQLVKDYVDVTGPKKAVHDVITERVLRSPKPSFVYAIKL